MLEIHHSGREPSKCHIHSSASVAGYCLESRCINPFCPCVRPAYLSAFHHICMEISPQYGRRRLFHNIQTKSSRNRNHDMSKCKFIVSEIDFAALMVLFIDICMWCAVFSLKYTASPDGSKLTNFAFKVLWELANLHIW